MKVTRKFAAILALLSLPGTAIAQTNCLTNEDAAIVATAMLPSVLEGLHDRCSNLLPPDSALSSRGTILAERYASAALAARPAAGQIAQAMFLNDQGRLSEGLGGGSILDFFETTVTASLANSLDANSCATANGFFSALEPLPAANMASLVVLLMEIGMRNDGPDPETPFALCRAAAG